MCSESDIGTGFYYRLSLRIEHDAAVVAVSHAQLLAEENKVAVFAVAQKDARFVWTQHNVATLALIYIRLRCKIMQVKLCIIRMLHLKRGSVQLARPPRHELVTFLVEHEGAQGLPSCPLVRCRHISNIHWLLGGRCLGCTSWLWLLLLNWLLPNPRLRGILPKDWTLAFC